MQLEPGGTDEAISLARDHVARREALAHSLDREVAGGEEGEDGGLVLGTCGTERDPLGDDAGGEVDQAGADLLAGRKKASAHGGRLGVAGDRVGERPVQPRRSPQPQRADLLGAKGDDEIDTTPVELIDRLAAVLAEVDPHLAHRLDRRRVDLGRSGAGALHLDPRAEQRARQPFRHLAARGVGDAEEDEASDRHGAASR